MNIQSFGIFLAIFWVVGTVAHAVVVIVGLYVFGWPADKVNEGIVRAELEESTFKIPLVSSISTPHGYIAPTRIWICPFYYSNCKSFSCSIWAWSPLVKQIKQKMNELPAYEEEMP
jgi:hypothetical protein